MNQSFTGRKSFTGYICAIGSGMLFGVNPTFRLMATDAGMAVPAVMALSMALGMAISAFMLVLRGQEIRLSPKPAVKLLIAGIIGTGLTGCLLLFSYSYISTGMAVIVHFTYPTLACITGLLFFRAKPTWLKLAAIVLSLAGVILISGGVGNASVKGVLIAFGSAVTFGSYSLFLAHDKDLKEIPSAKQLPYLFCGASLSCLLICVFGNSWGTFSGTGFLGALLSGLCVLFATLLFTSAVKKIGAAPTGFCSLFEPITCVIIGVLLRDEPMTALSVLGVAVSLSAVAVTVWDGIKSKA